MNKRSWVIDIAGAAVVTGLAVGGSIGETHPTEHHVNPAQLHEITTHKPGWALALVVLAGVALIWRRQFPVPVLMVIAATTSAYAAAGYIPGGALVPLFVGLFTVAMVTPRPVAIAAGVICVAAEFLSAGLGGPLGWLGGTNTVMIAFSAAATAAGMAVAGRRQVFQAMVERAERAERDREELARRQVDAERLRIARELHDVVAHTMSMIHVQAGVAAHVMSSRPEQAVEALAAIKSASREGLRELRAILNVLRQVDREDTAPAPGVSQLGALADASTQAGLPTSVSVLGPGRGRTLPPTVELAAYRIVQESLTNVLRHAGPEVTAEVRVVIGRHKMLVEVDDDGRGAEGVPDFDVGAGAGAGLAGMRERATAFGGRFSAGPRRGGGWRVRAILPIEDRVTAGV